MPLKLSTDQPAKARQSTTASNLPAFVTEEEAASYLAIDVKKLRRIRYDGRGPKTHKIGNTHRIRRE